VGNKNSDMDIEAFITPLIELENVSLNDRVGEIPNAFMSEIQNWQHGCKSSAM